MPDALLPPVRELTSRLAALGVDGSDRDDALRAAAIIAQLSPPDPGRERLAEQVGALRQQRGRFLLETGGNPVYQGESRHPEDRVPIDVSWLLAFTATAPEVAAWHRARGIATSVTAATLADLGRNTALHRRTHGRFGLETYPWLFGHWDGSLYQLGRLQFQLEHRAPQRWRASVHIPETGGLPTSAVTQSLDHFAEFAAASFPQVPVSELVCTSWMLDPQLAEYLPAESNILDFQRRFELTDRITVADEDILYFVFRRRAPSPDERAQLPRDSRLQRAVLDHLAGGHHWHVRSGVLREH